MIDATLVEADVKRPTRREGDVSERDPRAGFTRKRASSLFGTGGFDLIRKAIPTSAEIGEGVAADAHLQRRGGGAGSQGL